MKRTFTYAIILLLMPFHMVAQFGGGNGRGEMIAGKNNNQLDGAVSNIYTGGNGRGEIITVLTNNQLNGASPAIFGGGNGRGEISVVGNSNQLDGVQLNAFGGGNGRGEIISVANNSQLNGALLNMFFGGNGRGENTFLTGNNQLDGAIPKMFAGGNGRGEVNSGVNTLQLDGATENSMFLGGSGRGENASTAGNVALPVILMSFSAAQSGKEVKIQWQTSSELNSAFFIVEKSPDGRNWQSIGKVNAAGQSAIPVAYQSFDVNPVEGVNYYRLKPTDLDGQFNYSSIAVVHFHAGTETAIMIYPNPVKYQFTVKIQGPQTAGRLHISMVNAQGQIIFDKPGLSGNTQIFNISNVSGGTYFFVVDNNGKITTTKIVKE